MRTAKQKKAPSDDQLPPPRSFVQASQHEPSGPLLLTKLFVPPLRPETISRSRLLARLDGGPLRVLTLVSAPPGYGKTTLVSEWVNNMGRPFAWLALDEGDNDPVRFLSYFIAALKRIEADMGQAAESLLALPHLPSADSLATLLINDMASARQPFIFVLDDYHTVRGPFIHDMVEFLIRRAPPPLHVVLITRQDPPFPLAQLRARGQLAEIRAEDLRFTREEAAEWLNRRMGLSLGEDAVNMLHTRTEGWIAGLQLAGLSLQHRDAAGIAEFMQQFGGSDRYLIDYLLEEVLRRQADDVRRFLRQTAILDRFSAPLCDAVTGRADGKSMLAALEQANLFLIPLDGRREWYRYHPLFADCLRTETSPEEQAGLYQKAAAWYDANGYRAEAIEHALRARDAETAARWIEQAAGGLLQRGELATLSRWLEALPEAAVRRSLNLTAYEAWVFYFSGRIDEARALTTGRAGEVSGADRLARGRLLALRATLIAYREEWGECIALAREALDLLGDEDPFFRIAVLQELAEAERQSGHSEAATRLYREAFELSERMEHPFAGLITLLGLIPDLNRKGRRREALAYCRRAMEENIDAKGKPLPLAGLLHVPLAVLYYSANELEAAHEHVLQGLALYKNLGLDRIAVGDAEWTLVQILCAKGELEAALQVARDAHRVVAESGLSRMTLLMAGAVAAVQLKMGDLAAAARWAEEAEPRLPLPPTPTYEFGYFVLARIMLAQQRIEEVLLLLGYLHDSAHRDGRNGRLITIYILQALAHRALGNHAVAVDRLASALRIAAPQDYRRAFLDEGPGVAELLQAARESAPEFVDELLRAFAAEGRKETNDQGRTTQDQGGQIPSPVVLAPSSAGLPSSSVEPLSGRELEVLQLLATGKSNAEIAHALVVTVGTAKWHVHHLLAKLGAGNRTEAVTRARELGLI